MSNIELNDIFEENLNKKIKDVEFTFIDKSQIPLELCSIIGNTIIETVIEYGPLPEFKINMFQNKKNILFSLENEDESILGTVLITLYIGENVFTVKESISTIKNNPIV